jgi:hypothetical protein
MDVRAVTKVLIEDFPAPAYDGMAHLLKIWGDRYTFTGEIKNSAIAVDPGRFFLIVTSNFHPRNCFGKREDLDAIMRRFSVIEMTEENKTTIKRIRLDMDILTKEGNEEEEEEEKDEGPAITIGEAMISLQEAPKEEIEVTRHDLQGTFNWIAGRGWVKVEPEG